MTATKFRAAARADKGVLDPLTAESGGEGLTGPSGTGTGGIGGGTTTQPVSVITKPATIAESLPAVIPLIIASRILGTLLAPVPYLLIQLRPWMQVIPVLRLAMVHASRECCSKAGGRDVHYRA